MLGSTCNRGWKFFFFLEIKMFHNKGSLGWIFPSMMINGSQFGFFSSYFSRLSSQQQTKLWMFLLLHNKIVAMKMKFASWVKKVGCRNLGSSEPLSSFTSDENNRLVLKWIKTSILFPLKWIAPAWAEEHSRMEGSPCTFSSFKVWENKHRPVEERGVGKENGLVGS